MPATERPTRRTLSAYASSVEASRLDPRVTIDRLALEELINVGNKTFDAIADLDLNCHESNITAGRPYDDAAADEIARLYRDWADASAKLLDHLIIPHVNCV